MRGLAGAMAAALLLASSAAAQDHLDPCTELEAAAADAPPRVLLEHEGVAGVWLPGPVARHALCVLRTRELQVRAIRLGDAELELWRKRVEILREQLGLAVEARTILGDVVEAASRRAREAEERSDSVLRSPVLWFAVGAVATVAIALGARWLL